MSVSVSAPGGFAANSVNIGGGTFHFGAAAKPTVHTVVTPPTPEPASTSAAKPKAKAQATTTDMKPIVTDDLTFQASNRKIIGSRNTITGDDCEIEGDENTIIGNRNKATGLANALAGEDCSATPGSTINGKLVLSDAKSRAGAGAAAKASDVKESVTVTAPEGGFACHTATLGEDHQWDFVQGATSGPLLDGVPIVESARKAFKKHTARQSASS